MGAIRTSDGRLVDPFNPTREDVIPAVLMHAISCLNRYTGHARYPYSVGQHTLNLIKHVPYELQRAAMVHDFSEAWFNDLASPVKRELQAYVDAEHNAQLFIAEVLGVSEDELDDLDWFDKAIYIDERNALFPPRTNTGMGDDRVGLSVERKYFSEHNWRDIRTSLTAEFHRLFPEYGVEK